MPNNSDHSHDNLLSATINAEPDTGSLLFVFVSSSGERLSTIVTTQSRPEDLHVRRGAAEAPHAHEFVLHGTELPSEDGFRLMACQVAANRHLAQHSDDPVERLLKMLIPL